MGLGIIGGSGFGVFAQGARQRDVATPYGTATVFAWSRGERDVFFCPRHGTEHSQPPHRINYRANIWALWQLGVKRIIATATVGALHRNGGAVGDIVLVDQFLDFTAGRSQTFFEGPEVTHVDLTEPYCPYLRRLLARTLTNLDLKIRYGGCYVCTEGPRYESSAEVRALARLGGDVVGMTGVPEVVLAREAGICYATAALVTNWGAGITSRPLQHQEVVSGMESRQARLTAALEQLIGSLAEANCSCPGRAQLPQG